MDFKSLMLTCFVLRYCQSTMTTTSLHLSLGNLTCMTSVSREAVNKTLASSDIHHSWKDRKAWLIASRERLIWNMKRMLKNSKKRSKDNRNAKRIGVRTVSSIRLIGECIRLLLRIGLSKEGQLSVNSFRNRPMFSKIKWTILANIRKPKNLTKSHNWMITLSSCYNTKGILKKTRGNKLRYLKTSRL